jgi:hypothetical protein
MKCFMLWCWQGGFDVCEDSIVSNMASHCNSLLLCLTAEEEFCAECSDAVVVALRSRDVGDSDYLPTINA